MPTLSRRIRLSKTILNLSILFIFSSGIAFAGDLAVSGKPLELNALQSQAREYRDAGVKRQDTGDLDTAMNLYQKAIELDPVYAVAYNDLGVIYEAKGMIDRAEESYLKAIKVDPYYLSTYSNLALFYENKRELSKAAYCWNKRLELGDFNDPWTQKARQRLEDIRLSLSPKPASDTREQDLLKLMKDISHEKDMLGRDNKMLANKHFLKAKESYAKSDYATAVREGLDAQFLDPDNKEINDLVEKAQQRALTR